MPFGETLQELRLAAKLSQAGLADKAGLSTRSIQNWEQGHRRPRVEVLMALAKALDVGVEKLLTDAGPPPKPPAAKSKKSPKRAK